MNYTTFGILIVLFLIVIFYPIQKRERFKNNPQKKYNTPPILTDTHNFAKYLILKS